MPIPRLLVGNTLNEEVGALETGVPDEPIKTKVLDLHRELKELFDSRKIGEVTYTVFSSRLWRARERVCDALVGSVA